MTVRSFIDTNILVYADSADSGSKQSIAANLVHAHMTAGSGVLSTQVLQEFVSAALRKLVMPADLIRERLEFFASFELVPASASMISLALDLKVRWGLSFYDALIVQAARQSGCAQLLTEDMSTGAVIAGVRLVNPFDG